MSAPSDTAARAPIAAASLLSPLRPFYWSVRRELWEHRSIHVAPLAAAVVTLIGFLFGLLGLPRAMRAAATLTGAKSAAGLATPYEFLAFAVVLTGLLVGLFYCLGALHGERRDRSVLFWKSLPVSDLVTVLAKAAVPMLVLPAVMFATVIAAHLIMLALGTAVVLAGGFDPRLLWAHVPVPGIWVTLAQGLPILSLWYAPLYAWFIMVSAWARRTPYLWVLGPPLALALIERLALGTTVVGSWLRLRLAGPFMAAYAEGRSKTPGHPAQGVNPADLGSPHLWIGLVLAAAFLAAAVWLRRSRDPF